RRDRAWRARAAALPFGGFSEPTGSPPTIPPPSLKGDRAENTRGSEGWQPWSLRSGSASGKRTLRAMTFSHSETAEHVRATLGAILRRHRELQERSLADIAGPAGISPGFLSEVERGRKDVSTERLLKIARSLDVTIADVYLELARELGSPDAVAVVLDHDPRAQLRRMSESLDYEALRTVARFTTFLAMIAGFP